jgi:hypothetical protein
MSGSETSHPRPIDFERLGDLIGEVAVLRSAAAGCGVGLDSRRRIALLWAEGVGPEIAMNAEPVQFREGRLVVATSSSAWAQTLQLMAHEIMGRLNVLLGSPEIDSVTFRHAGWEQRLDPQYEENRSGPSGHGLSEEQRAVLGEVGGLDLDARLRERITEAMRASFVRGEQDSGR